MSMKLVIESTGVLTAIDGVPVRLWRGTTADNRPVEVFVHRIVADDPAGKAELDVALAERDAPGELRVIPPRMILHGGN